MKQTPFARLAFVTVLAVSLPIAACSFATSSTNDGGTNESSLSFSSSDSESDIISTPNVSYSGILEDMGASTYMQGTHKLTLDDGQMILLESTDANLNLTTYLGKKVEVRGSVQPTVEQGGTLMRVTEIVVLGTIESSLSSSEESSSSDISASASSSVLTGKMCGGIAGFACDAGQVCVDDPSDSCDPQSGGADCSGICVAEIKSSVSSSSSKPTSVSSSQKSVSSSVSSVSSSETSSSSVTSLSPEKEEQIVSMSKQSYDESGSWTQKYCTSHIGFCIPVHKNWYFKSFGATTTNLWHVEFGQNEIDELGQGVIVLNLVAGTSASMSAVDSQVKVQGSDVIGFKDTADGRHFELIADARLRAALEYMISGITPYELAQ